MKRRYFLYCSYNGAAYCGWQVQPNGIAVQEVLRHALRTVLRDPRLEVVGAGRTDAGVHAKLMVAHFDADLGGLDACGLLAKLNSLLPPDVAVHALRPVRADAHARFDAVARRYEYHVVLRKDVFRTGLAARLYRMPDFERMNEAARLLLGRRDFTSFSKLHTDVKTNICTVTHAEWTQRDGEWVFIIEADRFLRNMVRAVVGTLWEVGRGKLSVDGFAAIIEAHDRCKAGTSAPAQGLYLVDVRYPDELFEV